MKKILGILLASVLMIAVCAANLSAETGASGKEKTAVVYFSKTGNTRQACEVLAETFPVDLFELKVVQKPAAKGALPVIDPARIDLKPYSVVIVASPVWAANLVPAVRAFLKNNALGGKNVVVLTTTNAAMPEQFQQKHKQLVTDAGGTLAGYYQLVMLEKKDDPPVPRAEAAIKKDTAAVVEEIRKVIQK